jgi:CheY-like chemotaxis protein
MAGTGFLVICVQAGGLLFLDFTFAIHIGVPKSCRPFGTGELMLTDSARIMIVEANEDDAFLMERSLRRAGLTNQIILSSDAEEAKQKLRSREQPPHVLILSMDLKDDSACEFLKAIRNDGLHAPPLVLAVGSSNRRTDIQRALDLGANGYFIKQIDFNELASTLQKLEFLPTKTDS